MQVPAEEAVCACSKNFAGPIDGPCASTRPVLLGTDAGKTAQENCPACVQQTKGEEEARQELFFEFRLFPIWIHLGLFCLFPRDRFQIEFCKFIQFEPISSCKWNHSKKRNARSISLQNAALPIATGPVETQPEAQCCGIQFSE